MAQGKTTYTEAWRLTSQNHPDAAVLMRAYGATVQTVQFFNSRLQKEGAPSKAVARENFQKAVQERMTFANCSYDKAFNYVQQQRPDLADALAGKPAPMFSNAGPVPGTVPTKSPAMMKMLRLPMDATQAEFEAAYNGNGGPLSQINPAKIFSGLVEFIMHDKSLAEEPAIRFAKGRFPELWSEVEAISKITV